MPLQIRRGTTAQRLTITPLPGELIYDTDLAVIFVGDGLTAGGVSAITGISAEDSRDITGQMFVDGVHKNITFTYNSIQDINNRIDAEINLSNYDGEISASAFRGSLFADDSSIIVDSTTKNISASNITATSLTVDSIVSDFKGSLFADNSTILVNAVDASINLDGTVKGNIIPSENELFDLGSVSNRFKDLYLSGTSLFLGNAQVNAIGSSIDLPAGSTVGGLPIGGVVDIKGSVFADNSTLLVNAIDASINLDGTVKGNIIPSENELFDLGSVSNRFKDLYLSGTSLFLGNAQITSNGSSIELPAGSTVGGIPLGDGVVSGNSYNINILANDSSLLIDAETGIINAVNGLTTNLIRSDDSSDIVFASPIRMTTSAIVEDQLTAADILTDSLQVKTIDRVNNINIVINSSIDIKQPAGETTALLIDRITNDPTQGSIITFRRANGDENFPATVVPNDLIGAINFRGYDGTDYNNTAAINVTAQSTTPPYSGITSSLSFFTTRADGSYLEAASFDRNQILNFKRNSPDTMVVLHTAHNSVTGGTLNFTRSRNNQLSPQPVVNGDHIGNIVFAGRGIASAGILPSTCAIIRSVIDGTVSYPIVPGRIEFHTQNTSGNVGRRMVLDNTGTLLVDRIQSHSSSLTVQGDLIGSVFSDSSTMILDGTNGDLMVANINFIGDTGNIPLNTGTVDSWLQLSVNGVTKYLPLYA